jgi:hypothetical protein
MNSIANRVGAVKVRESGLYADLENQGYTSGHVVKCPHCDCDYRMFYNPGVSIMEQSLLFQPFEDAIERSHATGRSEQILEDVE